MGKQETRHENIEIALEDFDNAAIGIDTPSFFAGDRIGREAGVCAAWVWLRYSEKLPS
jgi:hypothetical protein